MSPTRGIVLQGRSSGTLVNAEGRSCGAMVRRNQTAYRASARACAAFSGKGGMARTVGGTPQNIACYSTGQLWHRFKILWHNWLALILRSGTGRGWGGGHACSASHWNSSCRATSESEGWEGRIRSLWVQTAGETANVRTRHGRCRSVDCQIGRLCRAFGPPAADGAMVKVFCAKALGVRWSRAPQDCSAPTTLSSVGSAIGAGPTQSANPTATHRKASFAGEVERNKGRSLP
jgi:hypothetical protein